jgi:hypothetical protein
MQLKSPMTTVKQSPMTTVITYHRVKQLPMTTVVTYYTVIVVRGDCLTVE